MKLKYKEVNASTNLWTLHVISSASHSITWHMSLLMALEGSPLYTATKRVDQALKQKGSDWSVSKGKAGGKVGYGCLVSNQILDNLIRGLTSQLS